MEMMTQEIKNRIPKLYEQEKLPMEEKKVYVKYFDPCGSATWYILEFDGEDTMFGYVTGLLEDEFGYVSLNELAEIRNRFGLGIERDLWFEIGTPLKEAVRNGL